MIVKKLKLVLTNIAIQVPPKHTHKEFEISYCVWIQLVVCYYYTDHEDYSLQGSLEILGQGEYIYSMDACVCVYGWVLGSS